MKKRTPTKQKLLNILKKDHQSTIKTIMEYFVISEIAVRKHLNELEQRGFIKKETTKQEIGRPFYTYELTKQGHETFPNQYEKLPLELLQDLEDLKGTEAVEELLAKRMERERDYFLNEVTTTHFDEKISKVAEIQDEKGYMVEYDKQVDRSSEMKDFSCPYSTIASTNRQVCVSEQAILAKLCSGSEVVSHKCLAKGDYFCKWIITKPDEDETSTQDEKRF